MSFFDPRARAGFLARLFPGRRDVWRALIVDPNARVAEQLVSSLRPAPQWTITTTLAQARAALHANVPDLVALELDLPDGRGLDLIASFQGISLPRRPLIIVTTSRSSMEDKIMAFMAGADDYLVKPVTPATFAEHVSRLGQFSLVATSL